MPRQTAVSQYRLWHFLALNFINIHEMNSRYAIVPILADVKASYNYNETQLGLLGSVFWFAFVIFCLPFGVLGDRYSRKKLLILGQLMEGLGLLLNATSTDFSLFCLGRIITGAFHGAFVIIAPAVVADMFIDEAERSSKTSIFSITISLGLALIFGIEPKIANQFGVTGPFYLFSLISFINAAILVLLPEYERGQGEKQQMELNAPQKIDSEEETEHLTPKKQVEIQEKSNIFKDLKYLISVKTFVFVCLAYGFLSCLTETGLVWIQEFLRRRFINLDRQIPCKTDLYYPEKFGPEAKLATESLVSSDLSSDLEIGRGFE